jgi:hypothetical protein
LGHLEAPIASEVVGQSPRTFGWFQGQAGSNVVLHECVCIRLHNQRERVPRSTTSPRDTYVCTGQHGANIHRDRHHVQVIQHLHFLSGVLHQTDVWLGTSPFIETGELGLCEDLKDGVAHHARTQCQEDKYAHRWLIDRGRAEQWEENARRRGSEAVFVWPERLVECDRVVVPVVCCQGFDWQLVRQ